MKITMNLVCVPIQEKRKKSVAWDYFLFRQDQNGKLDTSVAICKICRKSYANKGNTTNLVFHITHHHKELLDKEDKPLPVPAKQNKVQTKLTTFGPIKHLSRERVEKVDDLLLKMIVGKSLPVSLVSSEQCKNFIKKLEPRYNIPSKRKIERKLDDKFTEMGRKVKQDLMSLSSGSSLTHDGWTSNCTQSYDTVTCHFITDSWELKHAVLGTVKVEGQHTGEHIAVSIQRTVDERSIGLPNAVTTDNAANEQKALRLIGYTRFGCFGHRINLVVKKALECAEIKDLLKKGRTLVSFFHKSSSATYMLAE